MRPIKFRVWDKKEKKWFDNYYIQIEESILGNEVRVYDTVFEYVVSPERMEISEYTGLKDKNGKEICEGDIVRFYDPYYEKVDVGIGEVPVAKIDNYSFFPVEFEDGQFGIRMNKTNNFPDDWYNFTNLSDEGLELEIIGNIFENPELLEE